MHISYKSFGAIALSIFFLLFPTVIKKLTVASYGLSRQHVLTYYHDHLDNRNTESDFQELLSKSDQRIHLRRSIRNNKFTNLTTGLDSLDYKIIPCFLSSDPVALYKFRLDFLYFRIDPNKNESNENNQLQPDYIFSNDYSRKNLTEANIDMRLPTRIITHGFNDGWPGFDNWLKVLADIYSKRAVRKSNLFFFIWSPPESIMQNNYFTRYGRIVNNVKALGYYLGEFVINLSKISSPDRRFYGLNFDSFELMGHSLGAHVLGLGARYIRLATQMKIGRLVALDPAYPCFKDIENTIDKEDVKLLVTTHTNADLQGTNTKASDIDIFVNGGTLQPGCGYDATCSHGLARLLYNHVDDECQMIAYRCKSYDQFKFGACNACDFSIGNHILVNSEEQTRQGTNTTLMHISNDMGRLYFVNTNPIQLANESLCLQHYQIRLLIADNEDESKLKKCRFSTRRFLRRPIMIYLNSEDGEPIRAVRLNPIISGQLYTGLLNFFGKPKRFSFGLIPDIRPIKNINENCFIIADIAFMSDTQQSFRRRYSSLLVDKALPVASFEENGVTSLFEVQPVEILSATGTDDTCQTISGSIDQIIMDRGGSFNRRIYETSLMSKIISFILFIVQNIKSL